MDALKLRVRPFKNWHFVCTTWKRQWGPCVEPKWYQFIKDYNTDKILININISNIIFSLDEKIYSLLGQNPLLPRLSNLRFRIVNWIESTWFIWSPIYDTVLPVLWIDAIIHVQKNSWIYCVRFDIECSLLIWKLSTLILSLLFVYLPLRQFLNDLDKDILTNNSN